MRGVLVGTFHGQSAESLDFNGKTKFPILNRCGTLVSFLVSCGEPIPYKPPIVIKKVLPESIVEDRKRPYSVGGF